MHLAIRPGTNLAVLNGLAQQLIENDRIDREFVDGHTVGFEELEETVSAVHAERVAEICGVARRPTCAAPPRSSARPTRLLTFVLQGVYQSHQATASACAANNLNLLRGMIGRPGAGILQMNGQPTAQNTRETGCNGDLPGFRNWQNEAHVEELARLWNVEPLQIPHWGAADARDGDLPLRRAGLDPVPLDHRHEPGGLAARARTGSARSSRRTGSSWWSPTRSSPRRRGSPTSFFPRRSGVRRPARSRTPTAPCTSPSRRSIRPGEARPDMESSSTTPAGSTCATTTASRSSSGRRPRSASRPGRSARAAGPATTPG